MKRISFYLFAMLIGSMSFLMSCDDDDDATVSENVVGTYNGNLVVKLEGQEVANEPKSLSLVKNSDDAVDVVIKDFVLNVSISDETSIPVSLGDLKVEKCVLTEEDGEFTFSGTVELKGITVPIGDTELSVDCTINIADATVDGKNLDLPIIVGVSMFGTKLMDVNVQYTGVKQ